jgi:hypothetical protein
VRSAFCMVEMAIAAPPLMEALPLVEALPLMEKGAHAGEAATGVYLLGSRGPNAGITPPPGVYFQDDTYFYSGKIGGGTTLPTGGLLGTGARLGGRVRRPHGRAWRFGRLHLPGRNNSGLDTHQGFSRTRRAEPHARHGRFFHGGVSADGR